MPHEFDMHRLMTIGGISVAVLVATALGFLSLQAPTIPAVSESVLREYAGVYQWDANAFIYLQLWTEFSKTNQLIAFDESGDVRTLFPTDRDRFFAGPGAFISSAIESHIAFERDDRGRIISLMWQRPGAPARTARRVDIERHEDVRFANGA